MAIYLADYSQSRFSVHRRVLLDFVRVLLFFVVFQFICPSQSRADTERGWNALWENDIKIAKSVFENALDADDKDLWARRGLVITYLANGYDRDVVTQLEKLASTDNADALDYLLAMWVYRSILTSGKDEERFLDICDKLSKKKSIYMLDRRPIMDGLIDFSITTGNVGKIRDTARKLNRIDKWSILGSFDNTSMSGHPKYHIDISSPNMSLRHTGKAGQKFSWHNPKVLSWSRTIKFENYFERSTAITAYAGCTFEIEQAGPYLLSLSNTGAFSVVLDGKEIMYLEEAFNQSEYHHLEIKLNPGRHNLIVKVSHDKFDPMIAVALSTVDGETPKNVKYRSLSSEPCAGFEDVVVRPLPVMQRISKMLEVDSLDAKAAYWNLLALSYFDCQEQIRDYAPVVSNRFSESGILLWTAGRALAYADDEAKARQLFLKCIKADSNNVQGLQWQAAEKIRRKMYTESDSLLNDIVERSPQCVTARVALLRSYWTRGSVDNAVRMAEEMEKNHKFFRAPLEILAEYYESIGNNNEARKYRRRALDAIPKASVVFNKMLKAADEDDPHEAAKQWEKINEMFPDNPESYVYLAISKIRDGKGEDGYNLLKKAAELFPYSWLTQYYLGTFEHAMSTHNADYSIDAIEHLERAKALKPGDFETRDILRELKDQKPIRDILPKIDLDAAQNQTVEASDYPGDDACVLLDEHRQIIFEDGTRYLERAIIIKVLTDKGVEIFTTLSTGVNVFFSDLELKSARTIKPNGDEYEAKLVLGTVSFQSVSPGDILELHFGTVSWSAGKLNMEFWDSHTFQWSVPCRQSSYSLFVPPGRDFKSELHHELADNPVGISTEDISPFEHHRWTMQNVPALKNEIYSPDYSDVAVWLDISSVQNWNDIFQWYSDLSSFPSRKDKRVETKALELIGDTDSEIEKINRLYDYVTNQVIYEHVLFQYSGLIPEPAPHVLRNKQGDCKDKVCLLRSMLSSIGVDSYFGLVSPVNYGIAPILPSPRFNHAILAIPKGDQYWFLDPTAKGMSVKRLPASLQGANVLIIKPGITTLARIPLSDASEECITIETTITVESSGKYKIQRIESVRTGDIVAALVNELMNASQKDRDEYLEIELGRSLVGFDLISSEWHGLEFGSDSVVVSYVLELDNAVTQGNMKLAMIPWNSSIGPYFGTLVAALERHEPLALFGLRVSETENIRFKFPAEWRVTSVPDSKRFNCHYGDSRFTYEVNGREVSANRQIVINGLLVPPYHYGSFREFLVDVIREQEDNRIVLQSR